MEGVDPVWNSVPDDSWEAVRNREAQRTIEAGGDPCEGCGQPGVVQDVNGCDLCQQCADGCRVPEPPEGA